MEPVQFGKYEVLCRLATGGAASIFLARQPGAAGFRKLVCLKTLLPERADDDDFVAMFLDEARLAARLSHPNCVQIFDLGRVHGTYYISMEYIFGETLWNLLTTVSKSRVPLPRSDVAWMLTCACDGLHHAHELKDAEGRPYNLVHRDVSPQNIMVSFEGQTKVLDFGVAKAETGRAATTAGIVKGKFSYMSPEQITGGQVDRRSDVFSLGIVMFECLASRRLYRADTPEAVASLILDHRPPRLKDVIPDIDPHLDAICSKALARQVSRRYQTAQEMGEELREFLDSHRYTQGSSRVATLLNHRFQDVLTQRQEAIGEALHETSDRLLVALSAEPVRAEDLTGDEEELPDFNEETRNEGSFGTLPASSPVVLPRNAPLPPGLDASGSEPVPASEQGTDDVAVIRIPAPIHGGSDGELDEPPTTMITGDGATFVEYIEADGGPSPIEMASGDDPLVDPSEQVQRLDPADGRAHSDVGPPTEADPFGGPASTASDAGEPSVPLHPIPESDPLGLMLTDPPPPPPGLVVPTYEDDGGYGDGDQTEFSGREAHTPMDLLDTPEEPSSGRLAQSLLRPVSFARDVEERSETVDEASPLPSMSAGPTAPPLDIQRRPTPVPDPAGRTRLAPEMLKKPRSVTVVAPWQLWAVLAIGVVLGLAVGLAVGRLSAG